MVKITQDIRFFPSKNLFYDRKLDKEIQCYFIERSREFENRFNNDKNCTIIVRDGIIKLRDNEYNYGLAPALTLKLTPTQEIIAAQKCVKTNVQERYIIVVNYKKNNFDKIKIVEFDDVHLDTCNNHYNHVYQRGKAGVNPYDKISLWDGRQVTVKYVYWNGITDINNVFYEWNDIKI